MTDEDAVGDELAVEIPERPNSHPPERWQVVGQRALLELFDRTLDDVVREYEETMVALEHDHVVTSDHVIRLRVAVAAFERVVEDRLARLADGTDPWERTADRLPDYRLYEALGIDPTGCEPVES